MNKEEKTKEEQDTKKQEAQKKAAETTSGKQEKQGKKAGETQPAKDGAKQGRKKKGSVFRNIYIVLGLNLLLVGLLVFVLTKLPEKASELKRLKNLAISSDARSKVEIADLEIQSNIDKSDRLISLFPDEEGLVNFVQEVEKLKNEGAVKDFYFANEDAVKDKTRLFGIPFVIVFEGSWGEINRDLLAIERLNYLIRTVTVQLEVKESEEGSTIEFDYGGFIYVNEQLGKK
ncbi:MAG: hypothetical protein PVJ52_02620 [Candidatus Woesebacteria bacterium]|jgi:hypothetical protein